MSKKKQNQPTAVLIYDGSLTEALDEAEKYPPGKEGVLVSVPPGSIEGYVKIPGAPELAFKQDKRAVVFVSDHITNKGDSRISPNETCVVVDLTVGNAQKQRFSASFDPALPNFSEFRELNNGEPFYGSDKAVLCKEKEPSKKKPSKNKYYDRTNEFLPETAGSRIEVHDRPIKVHQTQQSQQPQSRQQTFNLPKILEEGIKQGIRYGKSRLP